MPLARAFPETQHTREEELLWQDGREYELSGLTLSADGSADAVPVRAPHLASGTGELGLAVRLLLGMLP